MTAAQPEPPMEPGRFQEVALEIERELANVIVGQRELVRWTLIALIAGGHVLLEGQPGLGKTVLVRSLAGVLELDFARIQFTPDLMPADVTGTHIVSEDDSGRRRFEFQPGPLFTNLLLADEINRATPKTQSALLEAMQERQVTVGDRTRPLPAPFFVLATQNPIELEGTYPLPEAQLDRFFFKLLVPFPEAADLAEIARRTTGVDEPALRATAGAEELAGMSLLAREVPVAEPVMKRAVELLLATHPDRAGATEEVRRYVRWGASPRGLQTLVLAGRIRALLEGRYNLAIEDLEAVAAPALRHRIFLNFEADAAGVTADQVVASVVQAQHAHHR
ncbi:MAG: AAA family ATPase [Candidatus Nephthysia bennettiae]|uniref:AAA family ATPase n=1 Tax=Candidatus Nephthysia bennettiae TaxID=3127016 RepID=A0A934N9X1_9BACT|nr:AAA family ATPase [Candidatus Dormibacteraeota bacterium]MBJ7614431.1 AAA family ATPase [Candidatus Dormibacteraeota bacterium]PZR87249.1 MAG: AAA family ATPase [Candidatus Dormibacteraeota bacterium]